MTLAMRLLCRVVKRRVEAGEVLETMLNDYPKLTETERELVQQYVKTI